VLARTFYPKRTAARISDPRKLRASISRILNLPPRSGGPLVSIIGPAVADAVPIKKLLFEMEHNLRVPELLWVPASSGKRPAVVYMNSAGNSTGPNGFRNPSGRGR